MVPFELSTTGTVWTWTTPELPPAGAVRRARGVHAVPRRLRGARRRGDRRDVPHRVRRRSPDDRRRRSSCDHPVLDQRGRRRGRHLRLPTGRSTAAGEAHERRRRDHRGGAAPVRPVPRQVRDRDGRRRRAAGAERRRRRVARRAVRVRRQLRGRQPRLGRQPARASPASRSSTCTTAVPPRRAC